MDFHLPAVTRFLAEMGPGPSAGGNARTKDASNVTMILADQLATTSAPPRLPKAVEAYFVGPGARGFQPVDADARYIVPFNKPPPSLASLAKAPDGGSADGSGTHMAKFVPPGSSPAAIGPPRYASLQTGQVAATLTTGGAPMPLDWSFLFGVPTPAGLTMPSGKVPASGTMSPPKTAKSSRVGTAATVEGAGAGGPGRSGMSVSSRVGGAGALVPRHGANTESGGLGLLTRRAVSMTALPPTVEGRFCGALISMMERLAATQSIQTGRYRSLRLQAAEHREAIISSVAMPPPPKTGAFSSKAAANRMASVLERSGASRNDMQAIVRQIQQFKGLSDDLRAAVADQFQLFIYPPGSYLYEQDCMCDEVFVLMSGAVMLHAEGRPPHRLQPGTVLGVELMLRRQTVPLTVTTDPHFEAQLAVLSWSAYEDTVRRWAADKVTALLPELQATQVARLKAGLVRGISYTQRQPGEALYTGGQPSDHVVLLVQGQVLMAAPLEPNTLITQAQMVAQLRTMIGPLAGSMVLNELPRIAVAPRGGLRGGLKGSPSARISGTPERPSGSSVRLSGDTGDGSGPPLGRPSASLTGEGPMPRASSVVVSDSDTGEGGGLGAGGGGSVVTARVVEGRMGLMGRSSGAPSPAGVETVTGDAPRLSGGSSRKRIVLGGVGEDGGEAPETPTKDRGASAGPIQRQAGAAVSADGDAPTVTADNGDPAAAAGTGQQQSLRQRLRSGSSWGSRSSGRNSRRSTGSGTWAAGAGAGDRGAAGSGDGAALEGQAEDGSGGERQASATGEAEVDADPDGGGSAAAALSRASRVSITFTDGGQQDAPATAEVGQEGASAAATGGDGPEAGAGAYSPGAEAADTDPGAQAEAGSDNVGFGEASEGPFGEASGVSDHAEAGISLGLSLAYSPLPVLPEEPENEAAEGDGQPAQGSGQGAGEPLVAEASSSPLPLPLKGLRNKISGDTPPKQASRKALLAGSSPQASGSSTPRSGAPTTPQDARAAKAAPGGGGRGFAGAGALRGPGGSTSGDDLPFTPPKSSLRASFAPSSATTEAAAASAVSAVSPSRFPASPSSSLRTLGRPLSEGRSRRPSSPMSEAPSYDDRRYDSSPLLHPVLPPRPTADPRASYQPTSGFESGAGAAAAAAAAADGVSALAASPERLSRLSVQVPSTATGMPESGFGETISMATPSEGLGYLTETPTPEPTPSRAAGAGAAGGRRDARGGDAGDTPEPGRTIGSRAGGGGGSGKVGRRIEERPDPRPGDGIKSSGATGSAGSERPAGRGTASGRRGGRTISGRAGSHGAIPGMVQATGASQPLANALASLCRQHQHRVVAVYGGPVVFCEEALSEVEATAKKAARPPAAHSAVALQRCEFILIPAALLRSLLPPDQLPALAEAAVAAQRRLMQASGYTEESGPVVWPAAADKIRDVLSSTTPGHRQPWQVELLASAFSHLPAFARLTWQVRLRVFQDLEYRKLDPGSALDLARLEILELKRTPQRRLMPNAAPDVAATPGASASASTADGNGAAGPSGTVGTPPTGSQPVASGDAAVAVAGNGQVPGPATSQSGHVASGSGDPGVEPSSVPGSSDPAGRPSDAASGSPAAEPSLAPPGSEGGRASPSVAGGEASVAPSGEGLLPADDTLPSLSPSLGGAGEASSGLVDQLASAGSRGSAGDGRGSSGGGAAAVEAAATGEALPGGEEPLPGDLPFAGEDVAEPAAGAEGTAAACEASLAGDQEAAGEDAAGGAGGGEGPREEEVPGAGAAEEASFSGAAATAAEGELPSSAGAEADAAEAEAEEGGGRFTSVDGAEVLVLTDVGSERSGPTNRAGSASSDKVKAAGATGSREASLTGTPRSGGAASAPATADGAGGVGDEVRNDEGEDGDGHGRGSSAGGVGRAGKSSHRGSGEPHTVEALFDPVAEEPLIPSLALRRRSSAADLDLATPTPFSDSARAAAAAAAALVSEAGDRTETPASVTQTDPAGRDEAASPPQSSFLGSLPATPEMNASPSLDRSRAGTPTLRHSSRRLGTAETVLSSEAPSYAPISTAASLATPRDSGVVPATSSSTATTIPPAPPAQAAAEAPGAVGQAGSKKVTASGEAAPAVAAALPPPERPPTPPPPPPEPPARRTAFAEKLDDRAYWCLSGTIALEAQATPPPEPAPNPAAAGGPAGGSDPSSTARPATAPAQPPVAPSPILTSEASQTSIQSAARNAPDAPSLPEPQQLQVTQAGDAFSGGALADAATSAFRATLTSEAGEGTPPSTAPTAGATVVSEDGHTSPSRAASTPSATSELQQQLLRLLPLGHSVLRGRVVSEAGAEVLCMSKTMFELMSTGIGRAVPPEVLPVLARHVDWLAAVNLATLAEDLAGKYRLEEHKQGTELLRAGEPAPVVFFVAAGECVMRGAVVGLKEPSSVSDMLDLATLREGATCGELSLLAARPLWYTLVVSSPTAKVISLDLPALRSWLLTSANGQGAAAEVVAAVAEVDIALYGRAVREVALQIMSEKLDMSLFVPAMRGILRRVMEDNGPELSATLERKRELEREKELKEGKGSGGSGVAGGIFSRDGAPRTATVGGAAAGKRPRDIVMEGWNQIEAIAAAMARPYDPQAQSWELIARARYDATRNKQQQYLTSLLGRSQLTTEEDAVGLPTGDQRIAMPAPGLVAEAMTEPVSVRNPKLYDIKVVPKDLRGAQVDASRKLGEDSYVPTHELTTMMGAQVHVKQAAALELLRQTQPQLQLHANDSSTSSSSLPSRVFPGPAGEVSGASTGAASAQERDQGAGRAVPGASASLLAKRDGPEAATVRSGLVRPARSAAAGGHRTLPAGTERRPALGAALANSGGTILIAPPGGAAAGAAGGAGGAVVSSKPDPLESGPSGGVDSPTRRTRLRPSGTVDSFKSKDPSPDLVPSAPWDAEGRLLWPHKRSKDGSPDGGEDSAAGNGDDDGDDDGGGATPLRGFKSDMAMSVAWSLAPLETLRGNTAKHLSRAPSNSSTALDPLLRAQLDSDMGQQEGESGVPSSTASPTSGVAGRGSPDLAAAAAQMATSYDSQGTGAAAASGLSSVVLGPPLSAAPRPGQPSGAVHGGGRRPSSPLASIVEEPSASAWVPSQGPGTAVSASAQRPPSPPPVPVIKSLPALLSFNSPRMVPRPGAPMAAWPGPAGLASAAGAAGRSATGTGTGSEPGQVRAGTVSGSGAAAGTVAPSEAGAASVNTRRSRIQARSAAPSEADPDLTEAPDRAFWVRDRLHDPRGLAKGVMEDAASQAVSQSLAATAAVAVAGGTRSSLLRAADVSVSSTGVSASANVLLAHGGRTALPASGARTRRLQPLRRNGGIGASVSAPGTPGGTGDPSDGGAAGQGAAAAAAATDGIAAPQADPGMLYVTLELPEAPKLLPEFPSAGAAREAVQAAAAAEQAAREARMAAAIAHHSTRPLFVRPDMKYVPMYLRARQRPPVVPPPARPLPDGMTESWVVPSYNSELGFQDGFYDENSQVIYFD